MTDRATARPIPDPNYCVAYFFCLTDEPTGRPAVRPAGWVYTNPSEFAYIILYQSINFDNESRHSSRHFP